MGVLMDVRAGRGDPLGCRALGAPPPSGCFAIADSSFVVAAFLSHLDALHDRPCSLLTVILKKMGRSHLVITYIKPHIPVNGEAVLEVLVQAKTEIVVAGKSPYGV